MKYVLVTGGVLSGIGKGVIASSSGVLLNSYGFKVTSIKIDPYINIDAGTMSPFEHGEVFILDDGGEVDLDLGNYERFMNTTLTSDHNLTTGKIYKTVIEKERRGDYLGKTVQVVPHICNEIQDWVERVSIIPIDSSKKEPEICIIELGGTVGDIEHMPFAEAMRQFQFRVGRQNFCLIHVSLIPELHGEQKTKPTQHTVRELRAVGLNPDIIVCRSTTPIEDSTREKVAKFCHVTFENVIGCHDVSNLYRVPLLLLEQGVPIKILNILNLNSPSKIPQLNAWKKLASQVDSFQSQATGIHIAIIGKYTGLQDAYLSVIKGLQHASHFIGRKLFVNWIEASHLTDGTKTEDRAQYEKSWKLLKSADGILVPGGFGVRGVEGKILACKYARENKIPYFGICYGLQVAVIEYAQTVLGWKDAHSEEWEITSSTTSTSTSTTTSTISNSTISENENYWSPSTPHRVVVYMPEISKTHMGGTMRLGSRKTIFTDLTSISSQLYEKVTQKPHGGFIYERHRHRYEVNPDCIKELSAAGLRFVGQDESGQRQEIVEINDHPFFVGVQYHPEMKSRPIHPSPPFVGFMLAAAKYLPAFLKGEWKRESSDDD